MRLARFRTHLLMAVAIAVLLLSDRVTMSVDTGGRGVLSILNIAMPFVVLLLCVFPAPASLRFFFQWSFWKSWGPYLIMTFALPIAGVLTMEYPNRVMLESFNVLVALSFACVGYWVASPGVNTYAIVRRYILFSIVAESVYSLLQFGYRTGLLVNSLTTMMTEWDLASQMLLNSQNQLIGRSIGTFINPNILGVWCVLNFWFSLTMLKGPTRVLATALTVLTLIFSESRGSLIAVLASMFAVMLYNAFFSPGKKRVEYVLIIPTLLICCWMGLILLGDIAPDSAFYQRLVSGVSILSQGSQADTNFDGRVNAWQMAFDFIQDYPWGTLASPQIAFVNFIDNEYVAVLLRGTFYYLPAYLLGLVSGMRFVKIGTPSANFVAASTVALAINAITAIPLSYPPIMLYWLFVGVALQQRGLLSEDRPTDEPFEQDELVAAAATEEAPEGAPVRPRTLAT